MKLKGQAALEVKVGVFVFLLLVLAAVVIFLLGKRSLLFEDQVELRTSFPSASGLRVGAQVRLAGVQVGQVSAIEFGEDPRDQRIYVTLRIRKDALQRVTTDSKARIDSMGLLGDKIIDVSVGVTGTPVEPGALLEGVAPPEYLALLDTAHDALRDIRSITRRLNKVITLYGDPKMHTDITRTIQSVRNIVQEIESGKGLVHALLYDRRIDQAVRGLLNRTGGAVDRFADAGRAFASAFGEVGKLLRRIQTTEGTTVHALLFGKDQATRIFQAAARAAEEFGDAVRDAKEIVARIKDSKGLFSTLIEEKGGAEIVRNLAAASRTLRQIVEQIQAGRGSVGALIADPTLYEDLKSLLGSLNRNRVLRALIRFAIQRREGKSGAATVEEATPQGQR
jgi:phospholipid/cholesterol/gamma-HCH transport system substrate-binding protein